MILKYFIRLITSYNWSLIIQREWLLYPTTSYKHFITCCNTITTCFIIKHFFFSRYRKCFKSDIISAATFQGCWAGILAARWYSIIHSTTSCYISSCPGSQSLLVRGLDAASGEVQAASEARHHNARTPRFREDARGARDQDDGNRTGIRSAEDSLSGRLLWVRRRGELVLSSFLRHLRQNLRSEFTKLLNSLLK